MMPEVDKESNMWICPLPNMDSPAIICGKQFKTERSWVFHRRRDHHLLRAKGPYMCKLPHAHTAGESCGRILQSFQSLRAHRDTHHSIKALPVSTDYELSESKRKRQSE